MPKIAVYKYLTFFFYAYDLRERRHVHIYIPKGKRRRFAKIWFENGIEVFDTGDLSEKEINLSIRLIENNLVELNAQYDRFLAGEKLNLLQLNLK